MKRELRRWCHSRWPGNRSGNPRSNGGPKRSARVRTNLDCIEPYSLISWHSGACGPCIPAVVRRGTAPRTPLSEGTCAAGGKGIVAHVPLHPLAAGASFATPPAPTGVFRRVWGAVVSPTPKAPTIRGRCCAPLPQNPHPRRLPACGVQGQNGEHQGKGPRLFRHARAGWRARRKTSTGNREGSDAGVA
jgi:hypothetical protein